MRRCLCLKLAPVSTAVSRPFQKSLWKVEGTWRTGSRPIFVPDTVLLPTRIAMFYIASDLRVLLPFYFFEVILGVESKEEGEIPIPPHPSCNFGPWVGCLYLFFSNLCFFLPFWP